MSVANSTTSQFCSVNLKILFWKLQKAMYCAYCTFIVRHSTRTIGSAKVRHCTYCKTIDISSIVGYVGVSALFELWDVAHLQSIVAGHAYIHVHYCCSRLSSINELHSGLVQIRRICYACRCTHGLGYSAPYIARYCQLL